MVICCGGPADAIFIVKAAMHMAEWVVVVVGISVDGLVPELLGVGICIGTELVGNLDCGVAPSCLATSVGSAFDRRGTELLDNIDGGVGQ